jgi:hypothetical protein
LAFAVTGWMKGYGETDYAPLINILWFAFGGQDSILLPIIFNISEVKITDSYHKFLGLTRIGDTMAES